jgi:sortase A
VKTRRYARRLAYVAVGSGFVLAAWVGTTLWRGDPITGAYATYRQRALAAELDSATQRREAAARATVPTRAAVPERYRVREGRAWGRILIPRIGVSAVVIQGTRRGDLESGPGHYRITSFPGRGRTVAIAGHRTTFGAWFRHIDALRRGDRIILEMPYGSFRYRVTGYRVVTPKTWSVIANRGYDRLVLSACHPLYSASHRWVVFAKLAPRA